MSSPASPCRSGTASQWITTPESANRASMLSRTDTRARGLADLPPVVNDSLLALIALCDADPRPEKIDVGVGVFRDAVGNTPILKVMKEAEQRLLDTQVTKAYLGSAGDKRFAELLRPILLGHHAGDDRIAGLQTPGGCGALRLGFELIATANPLVRVVSERGLLPLIDIAYQGFGRGLDEDAFGVRLMLDACDEVIIAQSCDKNFSVYRDRVGSL